MWDFLIVVCVTAEILRLCWRSVLCFYGLNLFGVGWFLFEFGFGFGFVLLVVLFALLAGLVVLCL